MVVRFRYIPYHMRGYELICDVCNKFHGAAIIKFGSDDWGTCCWKCLAEVDYEKFVTAYMKDASRNLTRALIWRRQHET